MTSRVYRNQINQIVAAFSKKNIHLNVLLVFFWFFPFHLSSYFPKTPAILVLYIFSFIFFYFVIIPFSFLFFFSQYAICQFTF